ATVSAVATRIPATIPISVPTAMVTPSGNDGIKLTIGVASATRDIPKYNRRDWRHWIDADGDCQNTRQEVLIAESETTPIFAGSEECRVTHVYLTEPYTGKQFGDASDLDVDHMVPLANAHRSGGWAWSKERKAEYANDLSYANHLIAVQASANRQKGSKGPEDWRPPRRGYWCQYATDWVTIKHSWGLTATQHEVDALREMFDVCADPPTLVVTQSEGASSLPSAPVAATPTPIPAPDGEWRYDPDGPDRDCGDFDTWDEAQAFYIAAGGPDTDRHRLDGDGDGTACNSLRGN
ncbi:MAG: DUF1524 domain-containing protein, partial [Chloroflexi bacterium]|nr:DUF1524 domain-containing protein [Chloroflexota bacterium]